MTETDKWIKGCIKKTGLSENRADQIISKAEIPLRKYFCRYCGNWHLTKNKTKL